MRTKGFVIIGISTILMCLTVAGCEKATIDQDSTDTGNTQKKTLEIKKDTKKEEAQQESEEKKSVEQSEEKVSKQKDTEQNAEEEKQETESQEWKAAYDKILEEHKRARDNNYYNGDISAMPNVSDELSMTAEEKNLFYSFVDLANDGIPEMLVGLSNPNIGYHIYDIYAYDPVTKQAKDIFDGVLGGNTNCTVCENGILEYTWRFNSLENMTTYYKMEENSIEPITVDSISEHMGGDLNDPDAPRKYYHDEEGAPENEITEEQYQEIRSKYPKAENLEWTALE